MITPAQVAIALGRPNPSDVAIQQQWQMWIDDAAMLLQHGDGEHDGLGDLTQLPQATLDYVLREAVVEMVRRPDNATQVEISVDDGRVSRRYETSTGRVTILDRWWNMLRTGSGDRQAFSIRPHGEPSRTVVW